MVEAEPKPKPEPEVEKTEEKETPTPIIESKVEEVVKVPQTPATSMPAADYEPKMVVTGAEQPEPDFGTIQTLPEEEYYAKSVITIYGLKGDGKTTVALAFEGPILCISYDRKSMRIKKTTKDPDRIRVFDLMKYVDYTDTEKYGGAMKIVYDETMKLLQNWPEQTKGPIDWIVIDGSDELVRMAEMVMRWRYNLGMTDGIKNLNVWKYRRFILKQIHNAALSLAKKGVIYTTYVDKEEVTKGGQLIDSQDIPKWLDVMMRETDHVFRVKTENNRYILVLESGKGVKSQRKWDITDKEVYKVVKDFVSQL